MAPPIFVPTFSLNLPGSAIFSAIFFCHFFSHSLEYYSRAYGNAAADRPQLASRGRRSAACARAFTAAGGPRLPSRRTRHPHALRRRHAHRVSPSKSFKLSKINFAAAALSSRSQLLSTHVLLLVISVLPSSFVSLPLEAYRRGFPLLHVGLLVGTYQLMRALANLIISRAGEQSRRAVRNGADRWPRSDRLRRCGCACNPSQRLFLVIIATCAFFVKVECLLPALTS